ncbi:hypothetical protein R3P38DRAFT_3629023 [Favolaschia claudopus]|uniref:Uncharacterized protein n=1 Tax=Favolaschia claudopus TaxID=2862362 RepID=A0AAV9ZYQ9_9AGAR
MSSQVKLSKVRPAKGSGHQSTSYLPQVTFCGLVVTTSLLQHQQHQNLRTTSPLLPKPLDAPEPKRGQRPSWWAEDNHGVGCFVIGNVSAAACAGLLVQFLAMPDKAVFAPEQVAAFITSNICHPFTMLTNLGSRLVGSADVRASDEFEAEFDGSFAIGLGGLHGLAPDIMSAYLALPVALKSGAESATVQTVYSDLVELSSALLLCLQHLRSRRDRILWDPCGGCRELAVILHAKDTDLPVASEDDFNRLNLKLLVTALDKPTPNLAEITFLLMDALGDASNPREMTADSVIKGGEFGMRRFYTHVVVRVLDTLNTSHSEYPAILTAIHQASSGIARKVRNYFKTGGSSTGSARNQPAYELQRVLHWGWSVAVGRLVLLGPRQRAGPEFQILAGAEIRQ